MISTFSEVKPELGASKHDIETPVVVADIDVVEKNLNVLSEMADRNNVDVRPHTKAHKIPSLARAQEEIYGQGVLCQKLTEAEVMVRSGVKDVMVVCPVVSDEKLERLCWVAEHAEKFAILVDCPGNIYPLAKIARDNDMTIDIVIEIDVGIERMGVQPGEDVGDLARLINEEPGVKIRGLLGHDNHLPEPGKTIEEYKRECNSVANALRNSVNSISNEGISVDSVITGASTTSRFMAKQSIVSELDPGRYIFNDASLLSTRPDIEKKDCALTFITTVISRPTPERAIVDAGGKTISYVSDPLPVPKNRDDIKYYRSSSEHGFVDVSEAPDIEVGDRLEFIVQNAYGPINIHETLPGIRNGQVREIWNISARGKDT